jgi:16S rRNA processing protein RimM
MTNPKPISPDYLLIGQITRPHGVQGEMRVKLMTDYPERIRNLESVYVSKHNNARDARPLRVAGMRMHQAHGLLRVEEVTSRDDADRMRQLYVFVSLEDAVPLADDEFYLYQVIGLKMETQDGQVLGVIKRVMETGANDVYVVQSEEHGEILFPITPETLIEHDIDGGIVYVNLLDGLIPH